MDPRGWSPRLASRPAPSALFTDIEGSTRLLDALGDDYGALLAEHGRILRDAINTGGGTVAGIEGDSFFAVFPTARGAALAAVEAQRGLAQRVAARRISQGEDGAAHRDRNPVPDGYIGMDVHRAARIAAAGHGGQVLLSAATAELVQDALPDGVTLTYLGTHALRDVPQPEALPTVDRRPRDRVPRHQSRRRRHRQPPRSPHHLRRPRG